MFAVITENDESSWNDQTGAEYHFPRRYAEFLKTGTRLIYYKGGLKNQAFAKSRLSPAPHYFAMAEAGIQISDPLSEKADKYLRIENFVAFDTAVLAKTDTGEYLEPIPASRASNYWRDGVRPISEETYNRIVQAAGQEASEISETFQDSIGFTSTSMEGGKKNIYTTRYERDRKLRDEAIRLHGTDCRACGLSFGRMYGPVARGFIHIHHLRPISLTGPTIVKPATDLVPLCPNCHSVAHRRKGAPLTIEELAQLIRDQRRNT